FMATVTASDGSSVSTGTVTFCVDGSVVATVPLTNGVATFSTSTLSAGSHTVTASYSGFVGAFALGPSSATLTEVITSIPRPPSNGFIVVGTDAGI
ncbi:Ig-like domain-containing protein, partial [Enterobacter hormaechei]